MRWEDVDFNTSRIYVSHALCDAGNLAADGESKLVLKDTKSDASERTISLDEDTLSLLKRHKEDQFYRLAYYETAQTEKTPVCANSLGEWYRPDCFTKDFEAFRATHGFDVRLHDLRHTQASLLLANGEDVVTVSKRLGHAKVSTTLDIYAHLMPGKDESAACKMGAIFGKVAV
ncbi:site-specific integrase [Adlercreutzia sp. ZJ138]|uniref:site-specific integrase n=1 Tax=Adlercreutzia sp. ZJ138 TaxID=2709405 RepID=UPI00351B2C9A